MKTFVSMVALAVVIAVTGPAFAQDAASATDKASCDKAAAHGMTLPRSAIRSSKLHLVQD